MNKQIVCISPQYWTESWFRKQQFMYRFHKNGFKVAYIEPSFSIVKNPENHVEPHANNSITRTIVSEIEKDLFIITPPRYLPYWSHPFVSRINFCYMSFRLTRILKKLGFEDYILWLYVPAYTTALSLFQYKKLLFDMVDDFEALNYKNNKRKNHIKKCVDNLVNKCDILIVTASTLYDRYMYSAKQAYVIPNGYDSALFAKDDVLKSPDDIVSIRRPIIGFVGTIFSYLDFKLVKYLLAHNRDKSFVFIGGCESSVSNEWMKILELFENAHWLGKRLKEEIPDYLATFDVCINPFKVDEVSRSVSPLKVYEYLAMKKPVVSVEMESLKNEIISNLIDFARNYEEFNLMINNVLKHKERTFDYTHVQEYSWNSLFEKLFKIING